MSRLLCCPWQQCQQTGSTVAVFLARGLHEKSFLRGRTVYNVVVLPFRDPSTGIVIVLIKVETYLCVNNSRLSLEVLSLLKHEGM